MRTKIISSEKKDCNHLDGITGGHNYFGSGYHFGNFEWAFCSYVCLASVDDGDASVLRIACVDGVYVC